MNMLDVHATALQSAGSVYHEFLLKYRKNEQVVYGVVEGKDDPTFYQGLIEQFLPSEWNVELIRSGNRANVLKTFSDFNWVRYPKKRICFFVDRDLSVFRAKGDPESGNLYVTDKYSIENEAASFGTVNRLLHDVLNISELAVGESEALREIFRKNFNNFCEWFAPIMAQIILWQRTGLSPALDNILPKDIFSFKDGQLFLKEAFISPQERIEYASRKVGCPVSDEGDLMAAEMEFRENGGCDKFVRGKYVLWFVIESSLEFHRNIALFCAKYQNPPKVKITMGHANAMTLVGPRIRCPGSLNKFVKENFLEYINPSAEKQPLVAPVKTANILRRVSDAIGSLLSKAGLHNVERMQD